MALFKGVEHFTNGSTDSLVIDVADEATASGVFTAIGMGEVELLEVPGDITPTDALATNVAYNRVTVMGQENATKNTTFVTWLFDVSQSTDQIIALFQGKTINGVSWDKVTVISFNSYAA